MTMKAILSPLGRKGVMALIMLVRSVKAAYAPRPINVSIRNAEKDGVIQSTSKLTGMWNKLKLRSKHASDDHNPSLISGMTVYFVVSQPIVMVGEEAMMYSL